jgi:hypothetical protein
MTQEVIKVADGVYAPTYKVIQEVLNDLLSRLKNCRVVSREINGVSDNSYVYVKNDKVMRQTWDDYFHGSSIRDDEIKELTDNPEDVQIIRTASNLCEIYKNVY